MDIFPTWDKIENHREVVQFACGLLAESDASRLVNHVGWALTQYTNNQLNAGVKLSVTGLHDSCMLFSLLDKFEEEGKDPKRFHPYFCRYNTCGHSLEEVIENTELAYIEDIIGHDFELNPSQAQIILNFFYSENFDEAWHALKTMQAKVVALHYRGDVIGKVTKLSNFSGLKYLHIKKCDANYYTTAVDDLAKSIHSWGHEPVLTYCHLELKELGPDEKSFLTALCKCTHLVYFHLEGCYLRNNLHILMDAPPPLLRYLALNDCSLDASDVDSITEATKGDRLPNLEELDISENTVGEDAVGALLETVISTRSQKQLVMKVFHTGYYLIDRGDDEIISDLPEQFVSEWKTKLTEFPNIKVHFELILPFSSHWSNSDSADSDSDHISPISLLSSEEPQEMMAVRPAIGKWVEFDPQK